MPDNKMLDGIKKINEQDLRKARETVLKSIGEKRKEVHAENIYQKLPKEDSGFNFEKNKKENIPQSRKVDGIFLGAQRKFKELIGEDEHKERENTETRKHKNTKTRQPEAGPPLAEKHENTPAGGWSASGGKTRKHENTKTLGFASKHENTKTRKHENTKTRQPEAGPPLAEKHKNTKTRKQAEEKEEEGESVFLAEADAAVWETRKH